MYLDLTVNLTYTVPNDCVVCVYQVLSWVLFYYAYCIYIYSIKILATHARAMSGYSMCRQLSWRCGTRTSALVPCPGCHPRSTLTGGGGARSTMLATRASGSESKEVLVWLQTVAKRTFELQYEPPIDKF